MASAYVFNTGQQPVALYLNQCAAGSLSGATPSDGYAPVSSTYPFNPSGTGEGVEFNVQTEVMVEPADGSGQRIYQVNASQIPPGQDFQLYLFPDHAVLSWDSGDDVLAPLG